MNVGIQREIRHGMVFSADYLRNVETRTLVSVDVNGEGNVGNFNLAGAQAAIAATNAQFGVATVDRAIAKGASMVDYAANGLRYLNRRQRRWMRAKRPRMADLGVPALSGAVTRLKRRCSSFSRKGAPNIMPYR